MAAGHQGQSADALQAAAPTEKRSRLAAGRYAGVYDTQEAMNKVKTLNPFVLPVTRDDMEAVSAAEFTVFKSDDQSWKSVNLGEGAPS
jgi:hypothetical protein